MYVGKRENEPGCADAELPKDAELRARGPGKASGDCATRRRIQLLVVPPIGASQLKDLPAQLIPCSSAVR